MTNNFQNRIEIAEEEKIVQQKQNNICLFNLPESDDEDPEKIMTRVKMSIVKHARNKAAAILQTNGTEEETLKENEKEEPFVEKDNEKEGNYVVDSNTQAPTDYNRLPPQTQGGEGSWNSYRNSRMVMSQDERAKQFW